MAFNRKLSGGTQWAVAVAAVGIGVLATLLIANTISHAGWSPWTVAIAWIAIVALATLLIKLRRTRLDRMDPGEAHGRWTAAGPSGGAGVAGGDSGG